MTRFLPIFLITLILLGACTVTEENAPIQTTRPVETATPTFPSSTLISCKDVTEIPQIECEAVIEINGRLPDTPCSWEGIECMNGHVIRVKTAFMNSLPPEIDNLSNLMELDLGGPT